MSAATPAVWAALALLVWSIVAIVADSEAAPPISVLVVVVVAVGLSAAPNRRMRTTGRLLLAFLAVVFATASITAGLDWVTAIGLVLCAATGLLAVFELI